MRRRTLLLAAPAALMSAGSALALTAGRGATIPAMDDLPLCESRFIRAQYMQGREATAAGSVEADQELLEALGLLEGHMLIGQALMNAQETRLALPHFGHPVNELYTWLESRIAQRRAAPFEQELNALEAAAKAGATGEALARAFAPAIAKINALRGTIAPERAADPRFQLDHVATMIESVAGDYGESIERGRISNILEYHDSAGFLRYTIATAGARAKAAGAPPVWGKVLAELEAIRSAAYAELLPPARPPVSITSVRRRAETVRQLADQV